MTNEMKLLTALCEALGFEVEVNLDSSERKEFADSAMQYNTGCGFQGRRLKASGKDLKLDIDTDGYYTSYLIEPITTYALIPKHSKGGGVI